jgi:hypothetical protein
MVSTTAFETTTFVEGDGFEGVGIMDNPMCCASHKPVCRKRASTVGASEDPSYQQSVCHGDSNILLILKRSTYHLGCVVYIVFSSLRDLILR